MSSSVQFSPIRSYLVHSVHWSYIWSNSVNSILFSPLQSNSVHLVHIGSILSTLVLFCWLRSYLVYSIYFGSISSSLVDIDPIQSILPTLIYFSSIRVIQYILVLFGPFCLPWLYSVHFVHFVYIQSTLVLFSLLRSIQSYLVQFGSLQFILVHFDLFLCTYIMGKDMFVLKSPNLIPNLL